MKYKLIPVLLLLSLMISIPVAGQKQAKKYFLTGIITDNTGKPVQGAMILVDKKNTNILSDDKGFYRVKVSPNAKVLTVFTIMTGNSEVQINGQTQINIKLGGTVQNAAPSAEKNEKVDVGYGNTDRKNVNSQVNKVDANSDKYASYTNVYDMLRGAAPGVQVIGKNITIQGASSGNSNSEPLFVVDGNIVQTVDDIHPREVKSIEVLKGASATIYGSRGQNGVIIIHLKGTGESR